MPLASLSFDSGQRDPKRGSYYLAQKGVYRLSTISSRYGGAKLPRVVVADMNQELLEGNTGPFSSVLMECWRKT